MMLTLTTAIAGSGRVCHIPSVDTVSVHMIKVTSKKAKDGQLCTATAHIDCRKQTLRSDCNCPSVVAAGVDGEDPVVDVDGEDPVVDGEAWGGASGVAWAEDDLTTIRPLRVRFCAWASSVAPMVPSQACNSEIRRLDTRT